MEPATSSLRSGRFHATASGARSALRQAQGTSTLPLVALTVTPLIEVSDVAGNASAAPRHEQRRAARERAGMRQALRAYRTGEHRIIGVDYATFSFPAHTRVASGPESPGPCRPHTFRAAGNPSGWNRTVLFPRRCPRRGAHGRGRTSWVVQAARCLSAPVGRLRWKAVLMRPCVGFQVFSRRPAP